MDLFSTISPRIAYHTVCTSFDPFHVVSYYIRSSYQSLAYLDIFLGQKFLVEITFLVFNPLVIESLPLLLHVQFTYSVSRWIFGGEVIFLPIVFPLYVVTMCMSLWVCHRYIYRHFTFMLTFCKIRGALKF